MAARGPVRTISEAELGLLLRRAAPHPLLEHIPAPLRPWLLPVEWSTDRLWQIQGPVSRERLSTLRWHFALPWWRGTSRQWFAVRPWDFLAAPRLHPEHQERVARADLGYPVQAIRRRGRTFVLDGIHRLVRAHRDGFEAVDVMFLDVDDLSRIMVEPG